MIVDTNCVLCGGFVQFILKHERDQDIRFINAWSKTGLRLAAEYGLSHEDLNKTYLVICNETGLMRSDAGIALLGHLKSPWRWLSILRFIPKSVRDAVYAVVAKHRYEWFGHKENCLVLTGDVRHRFIDD